jgi:hypothetical protein
VSTTAAGPREIGILMHARSIAGIEAGRKRQTRRIMKPQAPGRDALIKATGADISIAPSIWMGRRHEFRICGPVGVACQLAGIQNNYHWTCPFGEPGDLLWVRETWAGELATVAMSVTPGIVEGSKRGMVAYRASFRGDESPFGRWRPSIHMPKWACRYWLRVTGVRVERVQEITAEDARAEGIEIPRCGCEVCATGSAICPADASEFVLAFASLWDETNGAGAWDRNDWVWVVDFERTEAPR